MGETYEEPVLGLNVFSSGNSDNWESANDGDIFEDL